MSCEPNKPLFIHSLHARQKPHGVLCLVIDYSKGETEVQAMTAKYSQKLQKLLLDTLFLEFDQSIVKSNRWFPLGRGKIENTSLGGHDSEATY